MFVRATAVLGQLFLVLAHLLLQLLDHAIERNEHVRPVVGGEKIVGFLGRNAKFDQRGFGVFHIDDHANRGRAIKETRQALDLVANGLLNGVTQVTVLGCNRYFHPWNAPEKTQPPGRLA